MVIITAKCFLVVLFLLPTDVVVRGQQKQQQRRRFFLESSKHDNDQQQQQQQQQRMNQGIELPFFIFDDNPTFSGNGCLGGSVETLIPDFVGAEDRATITVLFSNYLAMTLGPILNVEMSCSMTLPVYVEPGRSVGIFQIDYRGYAYVPAAESSGGESSFARFDSEYIFAGQPGPRMSRTYGGGESDDDSFSTFDDVFKETDVIEVIWWSQCGEETFFEINTSLLASKPTAWDQDVFIALDSKDIAQDGFHVTFVSRPC